ncbi:MAG: pseudouridine synthase [Eubacteriales bacterium]|nr:pseudouridine synthase [Eubacteriales bacterium]
MFIRLDKYLADMKFGTRSSVKELIKGKQISVNDVIITKPETKINTDKDIISVSGNVIGYSRYEYYMLNKPSGVVSATTDSHDKTVVELIADSSRKDLFPVGRLDKDTEGLLLITNDGELSHQLLSPKKHVDKTYIADVAGVISQHHINMFKEGLKVDKEFTAKPARLNILNYDKLNDTTKVEITIYEGKFHQIKRMFEAIGSRVLYLKRISMGSLILDKSLNPGEYRKLSSEEINSLKKEQTNRNED